MNILAERCFSLSVLTTCLDAGPRIVYAHWSGVITQADSCCLCCLFISFSKHTGLMQRWLMFNLTEQLICFSVDSLENSEKAQRPEVISIASNQLRVIHS